MVVYDPATDPNTPERLRHLSDLRGAVARDELVLHYQPVYDLQRERTAGVEALVRWNHPTRGLLYPADFLGEIDEAGIGRDLARWVIRRCLADRAAWPVGPDGFQVAFNLSARDLADQDLIDDALAMLGDSGLEPADVIVEVTETVFLDTAIDTAANRSIRRLRKAGVRLVLDDFGTGHAPVTMLRDLRGSVAKIGGVFVVQMRADADDLALVKGLAELALHLNYAVLAEWVEDEETLELVRDMGCRFVQGFHIARPMPSESLVAWMRGDARRTAAASDRLGATGT